MTSADGVRSQRERIASPPKIFGVFDLEVAYFDGFWGAKFNFKNNVLNALAAIGIIGLSHTCRTVLSWTCGVFTVQPQNLENYQRLRTIVNRDTCWMVLTRTSAKKSHDSAAEGDTTSSEGVWRHAVFVTHGLRLSFAGSWYVWLSQISSGKTSVSIYITWGTKFKLTLPSTDEEYFIQSGCIPSWGTHCWQHWGLSTWSWSNWPSLSIIGKTSFFHYHYIDELC